GAGDEIGSDNRAAVRRNNRELDVLGVVDRSTTKDCDEIAVRKLDDVRRRFRMISLVQDIKWLSDLAGCAHDSTGHVSVSTTVRYDVGHDVATGGERSERWLGGCQGRLDIDGITPNEVESGIV